MNVSDNENGEDMYFENMYIRNESTKNNEFMQ